MMCANAMFWATLLCFWSLYRVAGAVVGTAWLAACQLCFMRDDLISTEEEGLTFTEVGKRLGEIWKSLLDKEKEPYQEQAIADKIRVDALNAAAAEAGDAPEQERNVKKKEKGASKKKDSVEMECADAEAEAAVVKKPEKKKADKVHTHTHTLMLHTMCERNALKVQVVSASCSGDECYANQQPSFMLSWEAHSNQSRCPTNLYNRNLAETISLFDPPCRRASTQTSVASKL
jgi:hypothetical protein